ncbi:MAG: efflux RND transporter permease subunit [Saprospiraceae bacterium]|nr:efflux RND transporter permease subunit [Saprospiraceae bacterium]
MLDKIKEFKPSSWSIDNKTFIYLLTLFLMFAGTMAYINIPKEQFPEVVFPQIMVNTIYPGTSPENMESLISKEIEKQVKAIPGLKKVTSNSVENFSSVMCEFNTTEDVQLAKQRVKDAVDKAKLPTDLKDKPSVIDIDISQVPIMNVHISGDMSLDRLKYYADVVKDRIEAMKEISRVDIVGALDREIQINVDMYKMSANMLTFSDIEGAVARENLTISGGNVDMDNVKRNMSVSGQFKTPRQIQEIILRGGSGAIVRLKDIADVRDTYEEPKSYARFNGKNVISLNVIKRGGQNLIIASDEIKRICDELQQTSFPKELKIGITGDQSIRTRVTLDDLINTIIIGFVLVTIILLFFMGTVNALFVALSVPLSMAVAFLFEPSLFTGFLGYKTFSLNMIVLFSFLLALGIVVDDAIVVIENTHRIFANGKVPIKKAAKLAAGEVFLPVLSGTLTTLAPFFPLAFWQGVIGRFMFYLPVTMIVTLFASLVVAYIINPVFAVDFMKPHPEVKQKKVTQSFITTCVVFVVMVAVGYMFNFGMGNFTLTLFFLYLLNKFVLNDAAEAFQKKVWPRVQNAYARVLISAIKTKWRALGLLIGTVALLFVSFILVGIAKPDVVFFPESDPNFAYTYIKLPVGTDTKFTDQVTKEVETRIMKLLGENNPLVSSVISNVAVGAGDPQSFDLSTNSNLGKVTVAFVPFAERHGKSTSTVLKQIREAVKGVPGAEIVVEKESSGPPTAKPISIEITGEDYRALAQASQGLKRYLDSLQIDGVEELKSDLNITKPEVTVNIDRETAMRNGLSTAQIGMDVRTSLFGKEITKFKTTEEDYPVNLRLKDEQRGNVNTLLGQKMIYRDMVMMGQLRSIPLNSLATVSYGNTLGGIKRKNQKRIVTLSSNVLTGFNPNQVVAQVEAATSNFKTPPDVDIKFGGEKEEQAETIAFFQWAMMASIGLIVLILVIQFNSISKMVIILSEIIFSIIGVLLGFVFTGMDIAIVMTGVGIIALAGIVVRNGILLVEFTEILLNQGVPLKEAIIESGRTRMTPVLLTASATTLGLIPLAIGMNLDFVALFTELNPHLHFGGDSVAFWGPLSWTMIYGLIFATFLTLILVPAMLFLAERLKMKVLKNYHPNHKFHEAQAELAAQKLTPTEGEETEHQ